VRPCGVWPWMVAATSLVMVVPPAAVWALSALGIITSLPTLEAASASRAASVTPAHNRAEGR
jgi:hypothetical protein